MLYFADVLTITNKLRTFEEPLIMYKNPTEYEFYESCKGLEHYVGNTKLSTNMARGCIDVNGNVYVWNPSVLHYYLRDTNIKLLEIFNDIYDEEKFVCLELQKEDGYEKISQIVQELKDNKFII